MKFDETTDIIVTDAMPRAKAVEKLTDLAETLVAMGKAEEGGVFVTKWGRGWAVAYRKRT